MSAFGKLLATVAAAMPIAAFAAGDFLPIPGAPGELRGQVTRRDGTPVAAFTVNGMRFNDPSGSFKVLVPPEGHFRVVIRAPGFAPSFIQVEGAAGKKLVLPEIVLGQGEQLLGEVVAAGTGKPVRDAAVAVADPAKIERLRFIRPERLADVSRTGPGGYYQLNRVPRGVLLLVVRHRDYLTEFVPVNTRQQPPVVKLHKPASMSGVVRDAKGRLAAGVRVVAISEQVYDAGETKTDSFGRWSIKGLRPGPYKVHAYGANVEPRPIELKDGTNATVALDLGDAGHSAAQRGGLYAQAPASAAAR